MESGISCVGCGEPLFGSPCHWCTCEQCGNDIQNGSCLFCGSRNSFSYDPNPNSFNDSSNFSIYPSHSYEQEPYNPNFNDASYQNTPNFSCEYCGGPHQGFECHQFFVNTQNFGYDQHPYDSQNQPHQFYCCEYCGGPHFSSDCQTGSPFPCNNHDLSGFDQPPQYHMVHTTSQSLPQSELTHDDLVTKWMNDQTQFNVNMQDALSQLGDLIRAIQIPPVNSFCYEDESDEDEPAEIPQIQNLQGGKSMLEILAERQMENEISMTASTSQLPQPAVITSEIHTHSLIMGDEHLDTIPEKESDEFIKSSVENLVPIPSESQGILEHLCDISPPLDFSKDHVDTLSDSNDDNISYGEIEYIEVSLPHSDVDPLHSLSCEDISYEPVNPKENDDHLVPETFKTTFTNPLFEFESEFTLVSDNQLFDIQNEDSDESVLEQGFTDLHHVNNSLHEEFPSELTHLNENENPINEVFDQNDLHHLLPEMDSFSFDDIAVVDISTSFLSEDKIFKPGILPFEETHVDELVMIVIITFFLFYTYPVTSPFLCHSFGSEDTIFDPGIFISHL